MLFTVQFPFADCRAFSDPPPPRILRPCWPAPIEGEFVRCFGGVRKRRLGGLEFWGEDTFCDISRGLRFKRIHKFIANDGLAYHLPIEAAFRRLYCDGLAVGKFEIGLATCWAEYVTPRDSRRLAQHILSVPVYVAGSSSKQAVLLGACGPKLVDTYVRATTRTSAADPDSGFTSVSACSPLLFIQVPAWEKLFPDIEAHGPNLSRFRARIDQGSVAFDGRTVKTWILSLRPGADGSLARSLRLSLCRLHAEHEALKAVCRAVLTHQISIGPGSCGSEMLQSYFNLAIRRIIRAEKRALTVDPAGSIVELSRQICDHVRPGERAALLGLLEQARIRHNILRKVADYTKTLVVVEHLEMSNDRYEVHGGAGAVGKGARAEHVTIVNAQQAWQHSSLDILSLLPELERLQSEMQHSAQSPEQFRALAEVADASSAAHAKDGPKALVHLKGAGTWALEIAQKIGIAIAAKAIESALHMK